METKKLSLDLQKRFKEAKTPEEVQAIALEAISGVATQESQLDTAEAMIAAQDQELEKRKLSDKSYRPEVNLTVDKNKVTVRIEHGINRNGKVLSIDDIAKDQDLIKDLLEHESTAVTLVPETE